MAILLRVIGAVWILITAKNFWGIIQSLVSKGVHLSLGVLDILSLVMFAGGIGLLMLREWGRWILLIGSIAFLILLVGPSLLKLRIGPVAIKNLVFYGIFVALLILPQAKAHTR